MSNGINWFLRLRCAPDVLAVTNLENPSSEIARSAAIVRRLRKVLCSYDRDDMVSIIDMYAGKNVLTMVLAAHILVPEREVWLSAVDFDSYSTHETALDSVRNFSYHQLHGQENISATIPSYKSIMVSTTPIGNYALHVIECFLAAKNCRHLILAPVFLSAERIKSKRNGYNTFCDRLEALLSSFAIVHGYCPIDLPQSANRIIVAEKK